MKLFIEGYPVSINKLTDDDLKNLQDHYLPMILNGKDDDEPSVGLARVSKNYSQNYDDTEFFTKFNDTVLPNPYIQSYIDSFLFQFMYSIEITTWYNVYNKFDHQQLHNHIGTNVPAFSCVVILRQPNHGAGQLVFRQPNLSNHLKYLELDPWDNYPNIYKPPMEEGTIIIFPSCLEHYVFYNQHNEQRVIFASNIIVKRTDIKRT